MRGYRVGEFLSFFLAHFTIAYHEVTYFYVDRELRSAWVSHRTRTFFLYLIQQFLLNLEVGLPLDTISGTLSDDGSTLAYKRPATATTTVSSPKINHHLIKFDTTQAKCRAFPQPINEKNRAKLKAKLERCLTSNPNTCIPRFNQGCPKEWVCKGGAWGGIQ